MDCGGDTNDLISTYELSDRDKNMLARRCMFQPGAFHEVGEASGQREFVHFA